MSEAIWAIIGLLLGMGFSSLVFYALRRSDQRGEIRTLQDRLALMSNTHHGNQSRVRELKAHHDYQQEILGRVISYLRSQPPRIGDKDISGIIMDVQKAYNRGKMNDDR